MNKKTQKEFYTTYEARDKLFVSHSTVIDWIESGKLKAIKTLGGHRRIPRQELERFMKKNKMWIDKGKEHRILIVDDDKAICSGLKELLEKQGFRVDIALDGFEAGVLAILNEPSLIILDLKMPGLDGFSACRLIKENPFLRDIHILVLTGYPSKENFQRITELGAEKCLAKPVQQKTLLREIKKLLKAR